MLERICGHNKSETVPFMIFEKDNCGIEANANKYARRGILLKILKACQVKEGIESRFGEGRAGSSTDDILSLQFSIYFILFCFLEFF